MDDRRRRLEDFWDSSREYYEQAARTNEELAPERHQLLSRLRGDERVLDLGSGSCENALWIPAGCRYVGMDISTTALAMAAEAGRPGDRLRGDAARLPFRDGAFDAVLSTWVLEHLHDPGATFAEVARVLRPGGLLLLVGSSWDLPYEMPPSLDPERRLEIVLRRALRQLRSLLGGHVFEIVREPRVLDQGYVPDADAVFVVQSKVLERYLRALGLEILEHRSLAHGSTPGRLRGLLRRCLSRVPLWRNAWGYALFVARRGEKPGSVSYRLNYL